MALRRGGDLRHPLSFRDYFFLAGLSKKSLSMKDFFDAASILYYGRGRQNRTAATPTPRVRTTTIRFPGLGTLSEITVAPYGQYHMEAILKNVLNQQTRFARVCIAKEISRSSARGSLFRFVQGFEAFGAGDNFGAVGQSGRLQIRLLFSLGGGVEFGGAQTHPFPCHHSFFFAKLADSGHNFLEIRIFECSKSETLTLTNQS